MAITATGANIALESTKQKMADTVKDKTALGKDDFMKLLLVELQHQDPTEPMDSEKILTQTSQLATLEAADKTNKSLANLATAMSSSQQFSTVAAIGKTADLGSNSITYDEGGKSTFEVYFPQEVSKGSLEIKDSSGNTISTIDIEPNKAGVYRFDWDGRLNDGGSADSGIYDVTASYTNPAGDQLSTKFGSYPIESIKFDQGKTYLKVGSNYVPLDKIAEVY
ncbi:MAG: flagellar basal-body rod modification protein FlgD [Sulfurimonas sp.]|jgi:flagellar basal-body rod modification protein FlgD